jgi:hypothetical protein
MNHSAHFQTPVNLGIKPGVPFKRQPQKVAGVLTIGYGFLTFFDPPLQSFNPAGRRGPDPRTALSCIPSDNTITEAQSIAEVSLQNRDKHPILPRVTPTF